MKKFFTCRLDVRSNNIGGKGLCALSDAMKLNQTLTHIFIWGNRLEESAAIVSIRGLILYCAVHFITLYFGPYEWTLLK